MTRWVVVVLGTILVFAAVSIGLIGDPTLSVSAKVVADDIASEVSTLNDWPPYTSLRSIPRSRRLLWRNQLHAVSSRASDAGDWALAGVLTEVLDVADEFDKCDLGWDLDSAPQCYANWLRYHLGMASDPVEVFVSIGREVEVLRRGLRRPLSDPPRPWLPLEPDRLISRIADALQQADVRSRAMSDSIIPVVPVHTCVSMSAAAGPPLAAYLGRDLTGCPLVRLDTAAARRWGPTEINRVFVHEVWPGHHLLSMISAEPLHPVLRGVGWLGFTEGWATYTEVLMSSTGADGGLPSSLVLHLIRLAILAQVDIGLHALQWSAERAVATLVREGGYSLSEANTTVSLILSRPGSLASYFLGYRAIRLARDSARRAGPEAVATLAFHRGVLGWGIVPLGMLPRLVEMERQRWEGGP